MSHGPARYYYKARMYAPELGRFLQTDPIGYEADQNLYAYVNGDPVNLVGPTGMFQNDLSYNRLRQDGLSHEEAVALQNELTKLPDLVDIVSGVLIGADLLLGGPTGEGIAPAIALQASKQSVKTVVKSAAKNAAKKPKLKAKERRAKQRQQSASEKGGDKQAKGTPTGNQRQNQQFKDATQGLSKDQKRRIHEEISGKNMSYEEIKKLAVEMMKR